MAKSPHTIQCRDDIWKRVEALAKRRGISTDEVVQAALVQLFSKKKKGKEESGSAAKPAPKPAPEPESQKAPAPKPAPERKAPERKAPSRRPAPGGSSSRPRRGPPPPRGGGGRKPPPPGGSRAPASAPVAQPLYLFCEGTWYTIDQEQFVIGRGSKYSDLPIKDANISRRHCAVVRRNGEYFIKDLGSTNGVEFNGERVDDHLVQDGHVYYLCDHELRFTFTSPH